MRGLRVLILAALVVLVSYQGALIRHLRKALSQNTRHVQVADGEKLPNEVTTVQIEATELSELRRTANEVHKLRGELASFHAQETEKKDRSRANNSPVPSELPRPTMTLGRVYLGTKLSEELPAGHAGFVGAFNRTGSLEIKAGEGILLGEAIQQMGGLSPNAGESVLVKRGDVTFNFASSSIQDEGDFGNQFRILAGDRVLVFSNELSGSP